MADTLIPRLYCVETYLAVRAVTDLQSIEDMCTCLCHSGVADPDLCECADAREVFAPSSDNPLRHGAEEGGS